MIESGIIFNIWVKAQTKQPEDCLGNDHDPLSFKSLLGIFLIFLIGFILTIILCFFEKSKQELKRFPTLVSPESFFAIITGLARAAIWSCYLFYLEERRERERERGTFCIFVLNFLGHATGDQETVCLWSREKCR